MIFLGTQLSFANEHSEDNYKMDEKAADKGRDIKRAVKKGYHRVEEAVCMKGDMKCAAKKAEHRMEEGKDVLIDKSKELKDKVD